MSPCLCHPGPHKKQSSSCDFAAYAGGTTKEYRTKMRSLHFNLKDPHNKELRAHVLRGDITPDNFVRMTANELASKVCTT